MFPSKARDVFLCIVTGNCSFHFRLGLVRINEVLLQINLGWWARTKTCWIQRSMKNTCPKEMLLLVFAPAFSLLFH